uniref:Odorant receptor n=1 Tax=Yemma signatus TaxID=300820 RepID=A0A385H5Y0_9HEMI|nr:odorant receptor [Yemma signatus]
MWHFPELQWMKYFGWWPAGCKTPSGTKYCRLFGYFLCFIVVYEFVPEFFSIIQAIRHGEIDVAIFNISQTALGLQWLIRLTTFLPNEKLLLRILAKLRDCDEKTRKVIGDEAANKSYKAREKWCRGLNIMSFMEDGCTAVWITRPLFNLILFGEKVNLIDAWTPIDTNNLPGWFAMYIVQGVHVMAALYGIIFYDTLMFVLLQMYHLQFDNLKYLLRGLKFPYRTFGPLSITSDFRFAIWLHQNIIQLGDMINDLIKYMLFFSAINSIMLICVPVYQFTQLTESSVLRPLMVFACVCFAVSILLTYCWVNNCILDESEEVLRAAYDNNWYEGSVADKRDLFLLIEVGRKKRPFGFIIQSNLELFIAIIKSAFSYYQFLDAVTS